VCTRYCPFSRFTMLIERLSAF